MAIDAKVSFMNMTEKRLGAEITADSMAVVMTVIADVLEGFEMKETFREAEPNEDLLNCYIEALKVQGRSEKTISRYRYILTRMMKDVGVPTRRITVYHLRGYLAKQQERGVMDTTAEGMRQIFSAYFNWLQRESLIEKNPCANLGTIKCARRKKKTFTDVDMEKISMNCTSIRDRALIAFLSSTGCRISEMTALNRDDITFYDIGGTDCVVHGKGNKDRTVYISDVAGMLLKKYLDSRKDSCEALFVGKGGKRLLQNGVRAMMKKLAEKSGVEHIHPHKFRRTLATDLARHGMPIQEVANLLGHDKIETTMTYVIVDKDDIRNSIRRYA